METRWYLNLTDYILKSDDKKKGQEKIISQPEGAFEWLLYLLL